MKKILEEFKEFALRGNVMDLAVGVIIGSAFQAIVTSLTDNLITPLLSLVGGNEEIQGLAIKLNGDAVLDFGAFISSVINFLIMAVILFALVKGMNTLSKLGKKKEEPAPTTKACPYCKSEIAIDAMRCPQCTSLLSKEEMKAFLEAEAE